MQAIVKFSGMLTRVGQALGPYLLLEIVMPGGTLFAFLLYLYRRRNGLQA